MNGSTACPNCKTRFRISEAQLCAHGGRVRCGHCMQPFDAMPEFIEDQSSLPDVDFIPGTPHEVAEQTLVTDRTSAVHDNREQEAGAHESQLTRYDESHGLAPLQTRPADAEDEAITASDFPDFPEQPTAEEGANEAPEEFHVNRAVPTDDMNVLLDDDAAAPLKPDKNAPIEADADNALDFSQLQVSADKSAPIDDANENRTPSDEEKPIVRPHETVSYPTEHAAIRSMTLAEQVMVRQDDTFEEMPVKRRNWLWVTGILIAITLLFAQALYFFRIPIASQLPSVKPALLAYCHVLRCTVPLPRKTALISIESSSLDADPVLENRISFNALLRNRAAYPLAFPVLALSLNDSQDQPLARRLFLPRDYLPVDENEQNGFVGNHEITIKLGLNTGELRPVGYRLELFYKPD